jgi:hypothetical protein
MKHTSVLVEEYNGMFPNFPRFYTTVQHVAVFTLVLGRVQSRMNLLPLPPMPFIEDPF